MATGTLISEEEYLNTSYDPDCEYEDGVLIERNVGTIDHGKLQTAVAAYFFRRRKSWKISVLTETRARVRSGKYMLPDICVVAGPAPAGEVLTTPPLIWIEILSPQDRHTRVAKKANDVLAMGCPYVWVIDPQTLESVLHTNQGTTVLADSVLRIPGTEIVVPLADVLED
jgi:Uma2 family endonuclease